MSIEQEVVEIILGHLRPWINANGGVERNSAELAARNILKYVSQLEPVPAPTVPVEDWSGLPERWKGDIDEPTNPQGTTFRARASNGDFAFAASRILPTRSEAIAAIPQVVNAARCLEGLPVISLPDGLPDDYEIKVHGGSVALYHLGHLKIGGGNSIDALAMLRLYAWHLALSPATAAPAREYTDGDLPEGYEVKQTHAQTGWLFYPNKMGGVSTKYPTRSAAIKAAIDHAQAWREAGRG
jgi:hypothetical protein